MHAALKKFMGNVYYDGHEYIFKQNKYPLMIMLHKNWSSFVLDLKNNGGIHEILEKVYSISHHFFLKSVIFSLVVSFNLHSGLPRYTYLNQ